MRIPYAPAHRWLKRGASQIFSSLLIRFWITDLTELCVSKVALLTPLPPHLALSPLEGDDTGEEGWRRMISMGEAKLNKAVWVHH
jgi:hypothetical protein